MFRVNWEPLGFRNGQRAGLMRLFFCCVFYSLLRMFNKGLQPI